MNKTTIRYLFVVAAVLLLAGCATVNSSTRADRLAAVASISSQDDLYRAVHETRYRDARDAAARRVTRPDLCARLATRSDLSADVRTEIVGRVSDPDALARIAADPDTPEEIRAVAVGRIDDSAVLLGLLRTETIPEAIRRAALVRIGDDEKAWISLLRAKPAPDAWVLDEAVGRVASPAALAAFAARREMPAAPRRAALVKISDPDAMVRIASLRGDDRELRTAAMKRIGKDEAGWMKLLEAEPRLEDWVQEAALPHVSDLALLSAVLADRERPASVRLLAAERVEDPAALAVVVSDRGDVEEIRRAALARIKDAATCTALLRAEPRLEDWILRAALVRTDDAGLTAAFLVDRDASAAVRIAAASRVEDPAVLASVVESRDDEEDVRRAALARIEDEGTAMRLLEADPALEDWVAEHAVARVESPAGLAAVLLRTRLPDSVRKAAAERLGPAERRRAFLESTDDLAAAATFDAMDAEALAAPEAQKRLLSLFRAGKDPALRERAMLSLKPGTDLGSAADQKRIAEILLACDSAEARDFAGRTITASEAIRLVVTEGGASLREWALARATPDMAEEIALEDDASLEARTAALAKVTDPERLARIVKGKADDSIRIAALTRVTDDGVLRTLARNDCSPVVRRAAVERLEDEALLKDVAGNDPDPGVRMAAVSKIADEAFLTKVATDDADAGIRRFAVEQVSDQSVLVGVALAERDPAVKSAAMRKLTEDSRKHLADAIRAKTKGAGGLSFAGFRLGMEETDARLLFDVLLPGSDASTGASFVAGRATRFRFSATDLQKLLGINEAVSADMLRKRVERAMGCSFEYEPETFVVRGGYTIAEMKIYRFSAVSGEKAAFYASGWEENKEEFSNYIDMMRYEAPPDDEYGFFLAGVRQGIAQKLEETKKKKPGEPPGTLVMEK